MDVDWKNKKDMQQKVMDSEIDKYILYSFKKNFSLNQRDIELFEPTKILGDVLEALIGAVYIDSGGDLLTVLETFKFMFCPFILYVAKHSKHLNHEPKEDFILQTHTKKIIPDFKTAQQQVLRLDDFDSNGLLLNISGEDVDMTTGDEQSVLTKMYRIDIIYNSGQVMCSGWGNTRHAAERNASINGLKWLRANGY